MILATILYLSVLSVAPQQPVPSSGDPGQTSDSKPADTATPENQTAPAPSVPTPQNPPAPSKPAPSAKIPGQTQTAAKRPVHKRKIIPSNCVTPAPADPKKAGTQTAPAAGTSPAGSQAQKPTGAPTNCPPPKIVIRQGGTSEPNIQLAGGPGGEQASQQRENANQMLHTTEANLKTIAGRDLTTSQQDMVKQIRQFMEQSRAAVTAGDLERARTLAWKAQLLSEEVVKPQK